MARTGAGWLAAAALGMALGLPGEGSAQVRVEVEAWWGRDAPRAHPCDVASYGGPCPVDAYRERRAPRRRAAVRIPPGHLPPPGACRVWVPGVPPGRQAPPVPCRALRYVPAHAVVLVGGHGGVRGRRVGPALRGRRGGPPGGYGYGYGDGPYGHYDGYEWDDDDGWEWDDDAWEDRREWEEERLEWEEEAREEAWERRMEALEERWERAREGRGRRGPPR